jgi:hypothetical protein
MGVGTSFGGGIRFSNITQNVVVQGALRLPTLEWTWFHASSEEHTERALSVYFTPIEALFELFRNTDGAPYLTLHAGVAYTFHWGGPTHSFFLGPGLEGGFSNDGSLSRGDITLFARVGYEYLYQKRHFGFRVHLEPFFQYDYGNLDDRGGNIRTSPNATPTHLFRVGISLHISFFAYSQRAHKP